MSAAITPLGVSVLGLLVERPMHPYEMYQILIKRSQERTVKVRPGSLYHTVDRLAENGLVRPIGSEREGHRPERTTYELTEAGHLALTERVAEMLGTPVNEYPRFPVALGEAHNLPVETAIDLLGRRLHQLHADLQYRTCVREYVERDGVEPRFWVHLAYLIAMCQAEVAWIEGFLSDLKSGALAWQPTEPPQSTRVSPRDGGDARSERDGADARSTEDEGS